MIIDSYDIETLEDLLTMAKQKYRAEQIDLRAYADICLRGALEWALACETGKAVAVLESIPTEYFDSEIEDHLAGDSDVAAVCYKLAQNLDMASVGPSGDFDVLFRPHIQAKA
jgi:hypothetical protein